MSGPFRDELAILLGQKTPSSAEIGSQRHEQDDSSLRPRQIWARLKLCFNDPQVEVLNPSNWVDASDIDGFSDLNPNDPIRVTCHSNRPIDFFSGTLFKATLAAYRKAASKWRKDTENGSGKPDRFIDWDPKEDYTFSNFTHNQQSALLTWIYMKDREVQFVLEQ